MANEKQIENLVGLLDGLVVGIILLVLVHLVRITEPVLSWFCRKSC